MIVQRFDIDGEWDVTCLYDVRDKDDLLVVKDEIVDAGGDSPMVYDAVSVLRDEDTGFTFTNNSSRRTLMVVSRSSSAEEMYDTIQHELKHAVDHICDYFDVPHDSERAAYLQGYTAKKMYAAVAQLVCPKCNGKKC